jgi:hypothetical protein
MRRLHELGDVSTLILQFGPYKGSTLAQIAIRHPEYVRQLVTSAQRPEVRAAAGRLLNALQAIEDLQPSRSRGSTRRRRPAAWRDAAVSTSPSHPCRLIPGYL